MSLELNGNNKPVNKAGVYKHKETGAKVFIQPLDGVGTPIADAFVQAGFVWVSDTDEPETVKVKK